MKLIRTSCTILLSTIIIQPGIARAENEPPIGSYCGGSYCVSIGDGGLYVGRDPQGRKLIIPHTQSSFWGKTYEWKHKGYIYRVTGIGNSMAGPNSIGNNPEDNNDYRQVSLNIISFTGRVILFQILNNLYYENNTHSWY